MTIHLANLFKDSAYKLTQFSPAKIARLEGNAYAKEGGKADAVYFNCLG